jgi:hypothetical protein
LSFKEYIGSLQTSLALALGVALPLKETLSERYVDAGADQVDSDVVPQGEIWEVTHMTLETGGLAGYLTVRILDATGIRHRVTFKDAVKNHEWDGNIFLEEGEFLRMYSQNVGALWFDVLGVKRYAPEALEDLLHKIRPIPLGRDVQSGRPRPDPVM